MSLERTEGRPTIFFDNFFIASLLIVIFGLFAKINFVTIIRLSNNLTYNDCLSFANCIGITGKYYGFLKDEMLVN